MSKAFLYKERLLFWCPGCDNMMQVCPIRWHWNGDTEKPTLSPSILQTTGSFPDGHTDICHCFVNDGNINFCADSTHSLKGQTVTLPHLDEVIDMQIIDDHITWSRKVPRYS